MKILIGYNGTDFARAAIEDMRRAGLPDAAEAHILTVAERSFSTVKASEAEDVAAAGADLVRGLFPNWKVGVSTSIGSPVREMIAVAESFRPDIVVLGEPNTKSKGSPNVFLGPVSQGLLTYSELSLRISRPSEDRWSSFPRLLIGFDGSPGSEMAIARIAARSWPKGTIARVISIEDDSGVLSSIRQLSPSLRAVAVGSGFASRWAETLAEHAMHELDKVGLCTELEVRSGLAQKVLVDAADEWDADCIFVAPHCPGNSYERFLLGSVSAAVAAHANCTVEVVR